MKTSKQKSIPVIDPNSRLIQRDPRKVTTIKKDCPSSQRSARRPSTCRKFARKITENEDYYQQEELIDEKHHLTMEINELRKEVAKYNKEIMQFIQNNKTVQNSRLSAGSTNSLNSLSSAISLLDEELSDATREKKEASREFSAESEHKLNEEIERQTSKIDSLSQYINATKQKIVDINNEIASPEIQETLKIGEEKRKRINELSDHLNKLDELEEVLMNQVREHAERNSIPIHSLTILDKLNKQHRHLAYQRMVKEKELKSLLIATCKRAGIPSQDITNHVFSEIYKDLNSPTKASPQKSEIQKENNQETQQQKQQQQQDDEIIIGDSQSEQQEIEPEPEQKSQEQEETQKPTVNRIIQENIRVKFNVPSDLGIPTDPPFYAQRYYNRYDDCPEYYDPNYAAIVEEQIRRYAAENGPIDPSLIYPYDTSLQYRYEDYEYEYESEDDPLNPHYEARHAERPHPSSPVH